MKDAFLEWIAWWRVILLEKRVYNLSWAYFLCVITFKFLDSWRTIPFPLGIWSVSIVEKLCRDGVIVDLEFISFLVVDRFGLLGRLDFLILNDLVSVWLHFGFCCLPDDSRACGLRSSWIGKFMHQVHKITIAKQCENNIWNSYSLSSFVLLDWNDWTIHIKLV